MRHTIVCLIFVSPYKVNTSLRFYFTQSRKSVITKNLTKLRCFYNYLSMKCVKIINELLKVKIDINRKQVTKLGYLY